MGRDSVLDCTHINLEQGMPTVEAARQKLEQALRTAKARGVTAMKIIHGYGSSGKGGAIKKDVQQILRIHKRAGKIKAFAAGENFSPFDADARAIVSACPQLTRDRDYSRGNDGITMVLL